MSFKNIKFGLLSLLLVFGLSNCDDYLDINDDPNRVKEVGLASLLPSTQYSIGNSLYSFSVTTSQVTQQIGSYFGYPEEFSLGGAWSTMYLRGLANADILARDAAEAESPHYEGVAKVLQAYALALTTDHWEAAPWTEAFKGSEELTPVYDSQESLYRVVTELLEAAVPLLEAEESVFSPGAEDLYYAGNLTKWVKAAKALQARMAIHQLNKGNSFAQDALNALGGGMESNADDLQLTYNSIQRNPWHTRVALANNTGNLSVAPGPYIIGLMTDDMGQPTDPRIDAIATLNDGETEYLGLNGYDSDAPTNTVDFRAETFYSTEQAPAYMMTYAEQKFIEAEAQFALGETGLAYDAYIEGITAHHNKLNIDAAAATAYLGSTAVAQSAGDLTLSDIMVQKYIALYLSPETWTDMRRYNYSTDVYPGFVIPDVSLFGGPLQRANYPADELNRNGIEVDKVTKPVTERMWRDL